MVYLSSLLLKRHKMLPGQLLDNIRVYVKGGAGGAGKKRYGGLGGNGGSVYVVCEEFTSLNNLINKYPEKRFIAKGGEKSGMKSIMAESGEDLEIPVPPGVTISTDKGRILGEINTIEDKVLVAKGGDGGNPRNRYLGQRGEAHSVRLDLKLIADIGLVGFPNAGKSTMMSAVSRASPKIAAYPFTTLRPQLGMLQYEDRRQITMADLPGLIEGAHVNIGMGHRFLKHVERTKLLLLMVDVHGFKLGLNHPQRTAFETIILLNKELELYKPELVHKPAILALNKMDIEGSDVYLNKVMEQLHNCKEHMMKMEPKFHPRHLMKFDTILPISAKRRESTDELKLKLRELLDFYADLEMEKEGHHEKAVIQIQEKLTERSRHKIV